MTRHTSLRDQLTAQYRRVWHILWNTEPPIVMNVGDRHVVIKSEDGTSNKLNMSDFHRLIERMWIWAGRRV